MDILKLRQKIVRVNELHAESAKLLVEINEIILKEFQKRQGINAGNDCFIPPLQKTDEPIVRQEPPCCGA